MERICIIDGLRTPVGSFLGGLKTLAAPKFGAAVGITAENIAKMHHISRETQGEFALDFQKKAPKAGDAGEFVPIDVVDGKNARRHYRFGASPGTDNRYPAQYSQKTQGPLWPGGSLCWRRYAYRP